MTARTFAQYPDYKILEHCRCITLDDLLSRSAVKKENRVKALTNALKTATAHDCAAHLVEWPDGVLACIVSRGVKSFFDVSPAAKIGAYRNAVAYGDVVYREMGEV